MWSSRRCCNDVGLAAVWRSLGVERRPLWVTARARSRSGCCRYLEPRGRCACGCAAQPAAPPPEWPWRHGGDGASGCCGGRASEGAGVVGLSLAVVNTPGSTVVSGAMEAIERWVGRLGEEGVFCRQVSVDYASHSAEMDPILAELKACCPTLRRRQSGCDDLDGDGIALRGASLDGAYWCRNLRQTVRLDLALAELIGDGHTVSLRRARILCWRCRCRRRAASMAWWWDRCAAMAAE